MSKISLEPNASGAGTFTLAAPNSNTNRTLTLPDESGTIFSDGTGVPGSSVIGQLASSNMPAGSVIQVVSDKVFTETDINTSSVTTTGYSVSIQPHSTSNDILVMLSLPVRKNTSNNDGSLHIDLYKDGSEVARIGSHFMLELSDEMYLHFSANYIDSPNTTNAITYDIRVSTQFAGPFRLNDANNPGELIAMEIAR